MKGKEAVRRAIHFDGPLPYLPKGELFIDQSFLEALFPEEKGYWERLVKAVEILDLDLVGLSLQLLEGHGMNRLELLRHLFLLAEVEGPFSFAGRRLGFLEAMRCFRRSPDTLVRLCEEYVDCLEEKVENVKKLDLDGLVLIDDLGGIEGPFFSLEDFRRILKHAYRRIAEMVKGSGLYLFFHSDGRVEDRLGDFLEMGYDCLHTCDSSAGMDPYRLKAHLKGQVCLMGHLDLLFWDEEKMRCELEKARREFCAGGLILGSSSGLTRKSLGRAILQLYPRLRERIDDGIR